MGPGCHHGFGLSNQELSLSTGQEYFGGDQNVTNSCSEGLKLPFRVRVSVGDSKRLTWGRDALGVEWWTEEALAGCCLTIGIWVILLSCMPAPGFLCPGPYNPSFVG